MVMGSYAVSPELSVSLLWKTGFTPSTIPIPSQERSSYALSEPAHPGSHVGLRINRAGADIDWSVSVFRGRSLLPQAGPEQPDASLPLQLNYPVITMIGADLAKNFSEFGTRFEAAYVDPSGSAQPNEPGLRRNLYLVAGVDRTFFPRLNVNLQLFTRRSWELPDQLEPRFVMAQNFNASTFMQQRARIYGMTMRISNAWLHDTLEAEVFVQRFFGEGDIFVQPKMTYAFSDSLRGTIGGQYYSGSGPQFGPLKRNNGLFVELRYSY
jgi:hypothetical protein